jgi:hypothetical protein
MTAYLKLRELNVAQAAVSHDRRILTLLDQYLQKNGFSGKVLTEEILEAWVLTLTGGSKTVKEKVGVIRNFSKYLNSIGYESFLLNRPREKSDYIPYIYSDDEIQKILHAFLFPGRNPNKHYSTKQMDIWFSEILRLADIDQRSRPDHGRGACLHCFRHVFVLKSMQQLAAAGCPVDMNGLLLPTYLGHNGLIDTDRYMRFSGVQVPEILDAFVAYTEGLLPRIEVPYAKN